MRRSKKSLGRAILVSFLSASMIMTTPSYALTIYKEGTVEKNENITNGLTVYDSFVTVNGSVSGDVRKAETVTAKEGATVIINNNVTTEVHSQDSSNITINGNVKGNIDNYNNGNVTVNGDVTTGGVYSYWGSIKINGNLNSSEDYGNAGSLLGAERGADVSVGKDVSLTGIGSAVSVNTNSYQPNVTEKDASVTIGGNVNVDTTLKDDEQGYGGGVYATAGVGSEVNVNVGGEIKVKSDDEAWGIWANCVGENNEVTGKKTESTLKIEAKGVDVTAPKIDELGKVATGIQASSDDNATTKIVIKGDVKSAQDGINIYYDGSDATTDIIVDGTIESNNNESGIVVVDNGKNNQTSITAWKINNNTENHDPAMVSKSVDANYKNIPDEAETKKLNDNINYIIRHEGTITLNGTRTVTTFNGDSFETAHANEEIKIHVKVDDEKKYRVDRVEGGTATATKNSDGSWTLVVPKNGGVDIRAVLVAIEQNENQGSSGSSSSGSGSSGSSSSSSGTSSSGGSSSGGSSSGGGSSSTRPGVNNASTGMMTTTPEGATVQTNVTKNDNSTVTTAAVRIGTTTANVSSAVSDQNGTKVTVQNADGNLAGASFKGVGQISADGATLVKEDGTTAKMAPGMLLSIENADGTSVGCFMDATGKTIATGNFEVYYMLGTDGKLHAHFVNPQGYFMTGIQVINGMTVTFNATGEMVSVL